MVQSHKGKRYLWRGGKMFEIWKAKRKVMRWLIATKGEARIKAVGGLTPWQVVRPESAGATLYAVIVSRGVTACPMLVYGGERDYELLRNRYRGQLNADRQRGWHVSVDQIRRFR